jgi:hypothetical protein
MALWRKACNGGGRARLHLTEDEELDDLLPFD